MKKLLSLTVLGLSLFTLAACGKSSSKTESKGSLDNEASKILTVKHGNVRQNFDKITMANASQEFSGGSNLDSIIIASSIFEVFIHLQCDFGITDVRKV